MRLPVLFAFATLLGFSSAGSNEAWGDAKTSQSQQPEALKSPKPIEDFVEDFQTIHNREQWDILKTKQQRLRTGKVQLEALHKKLQEKSGRDIPKPYILKQIEELMNYRPSDPRLLIGDVGHLPLEKKSSSRASSRLSSYNSPNSFGGAPNQASSPLSHNYNQATPSYAQGSALAPQATTGTDSYYNLRPPPQVNTGGSPQKVTGYYKEVPVTTAPAGESASAIPISYTPRNFNWNQPGAYQAGAHNSRVQYLRTGKPSLVIF